MKRVPLSRGELRELAVWVEQACGIAIGPDKGYLVQSRLGPLVEEAGCRSYHEFLQQVASGRLASMRDRIVDALTTNETSWFREPDSWLRFEKHVLPLLRERFGPRLRAWSAACSSGQEPYSLVMLMAERSRRGLDEGLRVEVLASDLSPSALFVARSGRYAEFAARRGLSGRREAILHRYFEREGRFFVIRPEVRGRVRFKMHNLLDPVPWVGRLHLVMLRNVMIYFSPAVKEAVLRRLTGSMPAGAILWLGGSETLFGLSAPLAPLPGVRGFYEVKR